MRSFLDPGERSNLIIALGDLALRFPNLLEPYTEFFYHPLADRDVTVRAHSGVVVCVGGCGGGGGEDQAGRLMSGRARDGSC